MSFFPYFFFSFFFGITGFLFFLFLFLIFRVLVAEDVEVFAGVEEEDGDLLAVDEGA